MLFIICANLMAENALHGAMADDLSLASWKTFCPSSSTDQAPCCPAMFIDFLRIQKIQANSSSCLTFVHASFYDRDKANMTERDAQFTVTPCHQKVNARRLHLTLPAGSRFRHCRVPL